jgi:hypothetical protein
MLWKLEGAGNKRGFHALADPVDRILEYGDFREAILQDDLCDFTCLAGTMVQEVYETHPEIREACNKGRGDASVQYSLQLDRPEPGSLHRHSPRG